MTKSILTAALAVAFMCGSLSCSAEQKKPKEHPLVELVKQLQFTYVGESTGTAAYQCFTDVDLQEFADDDVLGTIKKQLEKDEKFAELVAAVKQMRASDRTALLKRVAATYKPTWRQLGKISREGQTAAGQEAERRIAKMVATMVNASLRDRG